MPGDRYKNEAGQRYGRLTVVDLVSPPGVRARWSCRCDCGNTTDVSGTNLRNGHVRSCGCLAVDTATSHGHTAGGAASPTYLIWRAMVNRCTNPNTERYPHYGGRGITVCDRWLTFEHFLSDMGERPADPAGWTGKRAYWTLDRIDADGGYERSNCRWTDPITQRNNRRVTA